MSHTGGQSWRNGDCPTMWQGWPTKTPVAALCTSPYCLLNLILARASQWQCKWQQTSDSWRPFPNLGKTQRMQSPQWYERSLSQRGNSVRKGWERTSLREAQSSFFFCFLLSSCTPKIALFTSVSQSSIKMNAEGKKRMPFRSYHFMLTCSMGENIEKQINILTE